MTTTDLSCFGSSELKELEKLLQAWREQGLPEDFEAHKVVPMMNKDSGFVFLTNSDYQVAGMNGNDLESFYTCRECGHEGFKEDCQLNDEGCNECNEEEDEDNINNMDQIRELVIEILNEREIDIEISSFVVDRLIDLWHSLYWNFGEKIPLYTEEQLEKCIENAQSDFIHAKDYLDFQKKCIFGD